MAEMNPLRRRMIEDMKVRNLSPVTQRCYVHAVAKFAQYFKQPSDRLGLTEVRAYQIHLVATFVGRLQRRGRACASSSASPWGAQRWSSAYPTRASSGSCQ
jgi:integrase/recombinase XerD